MNTARPASQLGPSGADFLPDFCAGPAVFVVLFITELVAVLITLAAADIGPGLWESLLWFSIYLQWIGLCSAAGLCLLRRKMHSKAGPLVAVLAYALLLILTGSITEIAFYLSNTYRLPLAFTMSHNELMIRSLGVCAVISALTLRYFWLQHQWRREIIAAGQARYELLQARIRPHFLFNSLNSIAELTASQPQAAETAVEDLATLFRANLGEASEHVSLSEELELCRAYLRMEQLRLGDRLKVDWQLDPSTEDFSLPPLTLQPLIENAVRHGIECIPEGGCIRIFSRFTQDHLQLTITNPIGKQQNPGTGEALQNTEQRLHWLYGNDAKLKTKTESGSFQVELEFPRHSSQT